MKQDIRLFIGDKEVEFSQPPAIYYNYTERDMRNPVMVKSSFSKQITVEGTPSNNDLFGHYWNFERRQLYGDTAGPSYNPMQRVDFKLFVNGNLYEKGYCKLNEITRNGRKIEYNIVLYGSLGSMFSSLNYLNEEDDTKKTFADLIFRPLGDPQTAPLNLDFIINKETVNQAWNQLAGLTNDYKKWDVLNFAVCSEGVPEDFEATKVLINNRSNIVTGKDGDYGCVIDGSVSATGYSLGESRVELTSDMSLDLRSYLLRPVISVKAILQAIADPFNNSGFEVKYDSQFFNEQNPYYNDAFVTLSALRDLGLERVNSISPTATITKTSYNWSNINYTNTLDRQTNFELTLNLSLSGLGSTSATKLWQSSNVTTDAQYHNSDEYVKSFEYNESCFLQVVAYDANGVEVGRSNQINCISEAYEGDGMKGTVYGHFEKKSGVWVFCDKYGATMDLHFTLPASSNFSSLKMYLTVPGHIKYRLTKGWIDRQWSDNLTDPVPNSFYTDPDDYWTGLHTLPETEAHNRVQGYYCFRNISLNVMMDDFDGFFSGTKIPSAKLLQTPYSVGEWFLSYIKLFGLYVFQDPVEDSSDPVMYPKGVVHIVSRDTFYTDEFEDITEDIDRSKTIKINPTLAQTKWYNFSYQEGNGENDKIYLDKYGCQYGRQMVNTNLQFNNETTDIYDGSIFRNGVMVQEKCGYFMQPDYAVPVYVYDNFKYQLYKKVDDKYEGKEYTFTIRKLYTADLNSNGLRYYDVMPKLQIHSEGNGAEDGSGILLFFSDFINTQYAYNLTDDVEEMGTLCDGTPCWLLTTQTEDALNRTIAIPRYSIPLFSRDLYENVTTGKIIHSWNFGHPQVTYVPFTYTTDFDCIYDKCFRDYLRDLLDTDTKAVSCYVRLRGKPNPSMLRKWYYFDNAIWYANSIKDWNIGSYDPTLVEFIKVQDVDNYALQRITRLGRIQVILNSYTLTNSAQTLTGQVVCQNPSETWAFGEYITWRDDAGNSGQTGNPSPSNGTGTTNFSISVPSNSGYQRTYTIRLRDGQDVWIPDTYFVQQGDTTPSITFVPSSLDVNSDAAHSSVTFVQRNVQTGITAAVSYSGQSTGWITNVVVGDGTVSFDIAVNDGVARYASITITGNGVSGGTATATLTIYQRAGESETSVYPDHLEFNFDEYSTTEKTVTLTIGSNWTITTQDQ